MASSHFSKSKILNILNNPLKIAKTHDVAETEIKIFKIVKSFAITLGIYLCFLSSSYYQEKISILTKSLGGSVSVTYLILSLISLANILSSFFILIIQHLYRKFNLLFKSEREAKKSDTRIFGPLNSKALFKLSLSALSLTASAICSSLSLKHISFPTQVLVKSAKMIPVVLGSYLFYKKKYQSHDYFMVVIITISLVFFNLFGSGSAKDNTQTLFGIGLCMLSLIFDSYTGPSQEQLLSWCKLDPITMMFVINCFSFLYTATIAFYYGALSVLEELLKNTRLNLTLLVYVLTCTAGQFFIYLSINEFGSLYTCTITTTRKAMTTLLSIYLFGHKINNIQWICIFSIFSTLLLQQYIKAKGKGKAKTKQL